MKEEQKCCEICNVAVNGSKKYAGCDNYYCPCHKEVPKERWAERLDEVIGVYKEKAPDTYREIKSLVEVLLLEARREGAKEIKQLIIKMEPMMLDIPNWQAGYNQATIDILKLITAAAGEKDDERGVKK